MPISCLPTFVKMSRSHEAGGLCASTHLLQACFLSFFPSFFLYVILSARESVVAKIRLFAAVCVFQPSRASPGIPCLHCEQPENCTQAEDAGLGFGCSATSKHEVVSSWLLLTVFFSRIVFLIEKLWMEGSHSSSMLLLLADQNFQNLGILVWHLQEARHTHMTNVCHLWCKEHWMQRTTSLSPGAISVNAPVQLSLKARCLEVFWTLWDRSDKLLFQRADWNRGSDIRLFVCSTQSTIFPN